MYGLEMELKSTWYAGRYGPIVLAPEGEMSVESLVEFGLAGEPEVLSPSHPKRPDLGSNPGLRGAGKCSYCKTDLTYFIFFVGP
jgi:hypothetical protein